MDHLAFYNVGCEPTPGTSRIKLWIRRQARKVLLPTSLRLVELLSSLCHRLEVSEHVSRDLRAQVDDLRRRQEEQAARIPATIAFGWDYVAMVRRLAVLEEHVDTLLNRDLAEHPLSLGEESVRFPSREPMGSSLEGAPSPRPKHG